MLKSKGSVGIGGARGRLGDMEEEDFLLNADERDGLRDIYDAVAEGQKSLNLQPLKEALLSLFQLVKENDGAKIDIPAHEINMQTESLRAQGVNDVSFPHFCSIVARFLTEDFSIGLAQACAILDDDKTGYLLTADLRYKLGSLGNDPLTEDEIDEFFYLADWCSSLSSSVDHDGHRCFHSHECDTHTGILDCNKFVFRHLELMGNKRK